MSPREGVPQMKLHSIQHAQFFERGWFVMPQVFSCEEIERIRAAFDRLYACAQSLRTTQNHAGAYFVLEDRGSEPVVIQRIVWAGGAEPDLLSLSADPRLVGPALELLGSEQCEQLLCQAHFKMPGDGVSFDWHQDIQHRDKGPGTWRDLNGHGSYVQTILLVDDMTPGNGPLQFIPRSAVHGDALGRLSSSSFDYGTPMGANPTRTEFDVEQAVTVTGQAGDVLFFGPYAVHGSLANASSSSRRVLINGYAFPGANGRVYPGEGACRTLPP